MEQKEEIPSVTRSPESPRASNVKPSRKYERFGETIRYLTLQEWQRFVDSIDDYRHKLMLQVIYELGCRVGEFVRIQLKHLDFNRSSVFLPAENTKTRRARTSHLRPGLMNEIRSMLIGEGRMTKRSGKLRKRAVSVPACWTQPSPL